MESGFLPVHQTALVLIDCRDMPRIESHLERSVRIVEDRLAPPQTAAKYP